MGANHVELPEWVNDQTCETAYGRMLTARDQNNQRFARIGWKAAQARDSKLLKALEGMLEHMGKRDEAQRGQTRRMAETASERTMTTEVNLMKAAYETCLAGNAKENFEWQYGAAAWLCGYQT